MTVEDYIARHRHRFDALECELWIERMAYKIHGRIGHLHATKVVDHFGAAAAGSGLLDFVLDNLHRQLSEAAAKAPVTVRSKNSALVNQCP